MEEFEKVRSFIKLGTEDIKVQVHVEKDCQSMGDRETKKMAGRADVGKSVRAVMRRRIGERD